jgi:hypothetical protein
MQIYLDESTNKVHIFDWSRLQLFEILDRYHQPLSKWARDVEKAAVRL